MVACGATCPCTFVLVTLVVWKCLVAVRMPGHVRCLPVRSLFYLSHSAYRPNRMLACAMASDLSVSRLPFGPAVGRPGLA